MNLPNIINNKKREESIKFFIGFNKSDNSLYDNLYIEDFKIVIKIPMGEKDNLPGHIKIERFSLVNEVFLTSYQMCYFFNYYTYIQFKLKKKEKLE